MRTLLITLMFLNGCSSAGSTAEKEKSDDPLSVEELLMDQIERQVQLPPDAHQLRDYARYYAFDQGRVIGIFTTHSSGERDLRPGERRWLTDRRYLPVILDGGCSVVNIVYNTENGRIEQVVCNGVA